MWSVVFVFFVSHIHAEALSKVYWNAQNTWKPHFFKKKFNTHFNMFLEPFQEIKKFWQRRCSKRSTMMTDSFASTLLCMGASVLSATGRNYATQVPTSPVLEHNRCQSRERIYHQALACSVLLVCVFALWIDSSLFTRWGKCYLFWTFFFFFCQKPHICRLGDST